MEVKCPYCTSKPDSKNEFRKSISLNGCFYRSSDRKKVQRFLCRSCKKNFSSATSSKNLNQKKRQLNHKIARLLVAGVSQREISRILKINRKTVVRKFIFMGERASVKLKQYNLNLPKPNHIQFDDMETFEHSKCKPLSITLAVEEKTKDHRPQARARLFTNLQNIIEDKSIIKSDENPHYPTDLKKYFPNSKHLTYKGRKGAIVGQGELKKIGFDLLFDLNHTCAMFRARMNRLFRRTWCTTKKPERLSLHLALTALHHNMSLS